MVRGNMRAARGGLRVGMRGNFQKKSTFSEFFQFINRPFNFNLLIFFQFLVIPLI